MKVNHCNQMRGFGVFCYHVLINHLTVGCPVQNNKCKVESYNYDKVLL